MFFFVLRVTKGDKNDVQKMRRSLNKWTFQQKKILGRYVGLHEFFLLSGSNNFFFCWKSLFWFVELRDSSSSWRSVSPMYYFHMKSLCKNYFFQAKAFELFNEANFWWNFSYGFSFSLWNFNAQNETNWFFFRMLHVFSVKHLSPF